MKKLLICPLAVAMLILAWLYCHPADPAAWPRYEYFRCADCGGPASIDPHQPERWGCRECGYSTINLSAFRLATRDDCDSEAAFLRAMWSAGTLTTQPYTLAVIYREGGGQL